MASCYLPVVMARKKDAGILSHSKKFSMVGLEVLLPAWSYDTTVTLALHA